MGGRWNQIGSRFSCFLVLILVLGIIQGCWSVNDEGLALLSFQARVTSDPHGALSDWNPNNINPCHWSGVHCVDGEVQMLDLSSHSLEGTLAPELGKLSHLKSLILYKNCFSGTIPRDFEGLTKLELLDLRENKLTGTIPAEIGRMVSIKRLLLADNDFEGNIPLELQSLTLLSEMQFDDNLILPWQSGVGCVNRKFRHCIWQRNLKQMKSADSLMSQINSVMHYLNVIPHSLFNFRKDSAQRHGGESCCDNLTSFPQPDVIENIQNVVSFTRRRLIEESPRNLAALPPGSGSLSSGQIISLPTTRSSGTFPAVPKKTKQGTLPPSPLPSPPSKPSTGSDGNPTPQQPSADNSSGHLWKYLIITSGVAILFIMAVAMFCMCRSRGVTTIGPWKTGLSGQLQKAFITGAPKLNRSELETACEDFSNIIDTFDGCTVYKGTLSSGVEIAVASTSVSSSKDWSKNAELAYRKKIDTLSRVNHKNFVNLLGYCEEEEPFTRMMVFEYAPNGNLFDHLHVKEVGHLDWSARMRIIMGTAYCIQYMHHDLNPPVAHSNLHSTAIYLTDDYAAKIAEVSFSTLAAIKSKSSGEHESEHSELPPLADLETNVYDFGVLLLEIISGKLPYSEEQGPLVNWAAEFLNDKRSISYMIDQSLKSFKNNELDVICEVIQDCIKPDPRMRPTMKDITSRLREVIGISPDQAVPRLSPLWWAELEILSVEAT